MKKAVIKTVLIFLVFLFLNGCAKEDIMDLYGFTGRFTYSNISPTDFYSEKAEEGKVSYYTFFEKENPRVMLKLLCNNENKTEEIRIYLPKYDENANNKIINAESINLFINVVSASAEAFTGYDKSTVEDIINQMRLYEKKSYENEGELTKIKNNFYFIYHSASLGSEFIIYNTYLKIIPETQKPESKPLYGDTTKIRTETVPTK